MEFAGIKRRRGRPSKYLHVWCMDRMKKEAALRQSGKQDPSPLQSETGPCSGQTNNPPSMQVIGDLEPKASKKAGATSHCVPTTISALTADRCDNSASTLRTHSKCSNPSKQMVSANSIGRNADSCPEIGDWPGSSDGKPMSEIEEGMRSNTIETSEQPNGQMHKQEQKSRRQSSTLQQLLQKPPLSEHSYRYAPPRRNLKREIVPLRRRRRWMSVPSSGEEVSSNTLRVFYEKGGRCFEDWAREQKRSGRRHIYEPYLDVDKGGFFLTTTSFEHSSRPSKTNVSTETSAHIKYGSVAGYLHTNTKSPSLLYKVMKEYDELSRLFSEEDLTEGMLPLDHTEEIEPLDLSTKSNFRMENCNAY